MRVVAIAVSILLIVGLGSCGGKDTCTPTDEREFLATCFERALEVEPSIPDGRCADILHWARDLFECTPPMAMQFVNTLFDGILAEDPTERDASRSKVERIEVECVRLSQDDSTDP